MLLRSRLHAHLDMTSIEWAKGGLSAKAFRAAARFEAATLLLAVTRGASRDAFERVAKQSQAEARERNAERSQRPPTREARG